MSFKQLDRLIYKLTTHPL